MSGLCGCKLRCCDVDDDEGTCKGLPEPPKVPLIEVVLVHRDDVPAGGGTDG